MPKKKMFRLKYVKQNKTSNENVTKLRPSAS